LPTPKGGHWTGLSRHRPRRPSKKTHYRVKPLYETNCVEICVDRAVLPHKMRRHDAELAQISEVTQNFVFIFQKMTSRYKDRWPEKNDSKREIYAVR